MKPTQRIDLLTTIKGTLVSFFSIFMFVTLGVGVFLGIHWLTGSLHAMADGALATGHAHDLEISYPYGLTDADLARLADLTGVDEVEAGSVAYAQLAQSDESFVLKFHTLPKGIDTFISQEGTLPTDAYHVAVERTWAEKAGLKIGDSITLAEQKDGASNGLKQSSYEITALVTSPTYLETESWSYGASPLGDGSVKGVCWLVEDAFDPAYFQGAKPYVTLRSRELEGLSTFDDTYRARAQELEDRVAALGTELAAARYDELHAQAENSLAEGQKAYDEAASSLTQARADLDAGQRSYDEAAATLDQLPEPQRSALAAQLDAQAAQLANARTQIADGERQLEEKRSELDQARADVDKLTQTAWVTLQRRHNASVNLIETYADVMGRLRWSMASLFLVVGVFVCYSAMSRIVYEQTVQIGTKKALGVTRSEITRHFVLYAAAALAIGVLLAVPVSLFAVQTLILHTLNSYFVIDASFHFALGDLVLLAILESALIMASTWLAVRSVLARHAVELLAGEEPPTAKRRFYETWGLWKRLSLLAQTTVNNCVNDSRRVLSTIIGVAGCTALVVTAVTLARQVAMSPVCQYDELYHYDTVVYVDPGEETARAVGDALADAGVKSTPVMRSAYTLELPDASKSTARVTVPVDEQAYRDSFHTLRVVDGGLDASGVIVSQAYAEHMGARVGDKVELTDAAGHVHSLPVTGFFEHHLQGFEILMKRELYEKTFGVDVEPSCLLVDSGDKDVQQIRDIVKDVPGYRACTDERSLQEAAFGEFLQLALEVVFVYLALACVMAFVVLLNLDVMFIAEKRRELIVLMICGYSTKKAKGYIWHDSAALTVLGIVCGVALGVVTGGLAVVSVETPDIMCMRGVSWLAVGCGTLASTILSMAVLVYALKAIPSFDLSDINRL